MVTNREIVTKLAIDHPFVSDMGDEIAVGAREIAGQGRLPVLFVNGYEIQLTADEGFALAKVLKMAVAGEVQGV